MEEGRRFSIARKNEHIERRPRQERKDSRSKQRLMWPFRFRSPTSCRGWRFRRESDTIRKFEKQGKGRWGAFMFRTVTNRGSKGLPSWTTFEDASQPRAAPPAEVGIDGQCRRRFA